MANPARMAKLSGAVRSTRERVIGGSWQARAMLTLAYGCGRRAGEVPHHFANLRHGLADAVRIAVLEYRSGPGYCGAPAEGCLRYWISIVCLLRLDRFKLGSVMCSRVVAGL